MMTTSVSGLILALSAILVFSIILILLNGIFYFDSGVRSMFFFGWMVVSLIVLVFWVLKPIIRAPEMRRITVQIEEKYPELKTSLISAFDLMDIEPLDVGCSRELIEAVIENTESRISKLKPQKIAPLTRVRETSAFLGLSLLILVGFLAAFPTTFQDGLKRGVSPIKYFPRPTLTTLKVIPGDEQVTKYGDLEITIDAAGKIPEEVLVYRIFETGSERGFKAIKVEDSDRRWTFTFEDVKRDFQYYVTGGDFVSRKFNIEVVNRPRVIGLTLTFDYPNYTGLATQRLEENEGSVDVPFGTFVTVEARFSKEIVSGALVFSDTTEKAMEIRRESAKTSFRAIKQGSYSIRVKDAEGLPNDDPIEYAIRVRMDEYPTVEITNPGVDIDLTEDMLVPLSILAEDDYGFSAFKLIWFIENAPEDTSEIGLPFTLRGKPQLALDYLWDLSVIGMVPNDIALYWVEAFDNDCVTGPKKAKSRVYSVRFPSIDEIIRDVNEERNLQISDVEEIAKQERDLQEELTELTREMMRQSQAEVPYEQREDLREALQRQQELAQQLEETAERYEQTTQKVTEQQLASMEIIQKMLEIQQLLQEVATEEMREAMKNLQEALESMDPEELRRAAEEFQVTQEEMLERLERTLSLLQRMKVEQRIEDMKALSEKLQEMEDKVSEGLKSGEMSPEDMQRMQDRITEGSELLEQGLKELAEMMKEFDDMPAEQAQQLAQETSENSPSQKSGQCSANMQSGAVSKCQKQASELSEQFEQTAEQLEQMQKQMQQNMSMESMAAIRRAVFGLLDLSDRQENIITKLGRNLVDREIARSLGKDAADIDLALRRITAEIVEIANKNIMIPPSIGAILGTALQQMEAMLGELEQGRGHSASPAGSEAMAAMNVAAEKLLETMEMMNSQSSSSCSGGQSFFQQMQGMCDKQGQINQGSIPLAQGGQSGGSMPGGLSPDQQAAASRLAAEQEAVRKSMGELSQEAGQRSDIAGRMDDILDDMDEVVKDLRNRGADERTLQRQERILNRMLDIQKSLHKQEYEERRKSRTGQEIVRRSPDQLPEDLGERRDVLQQQLLRAMNQPYPKEYEALIKSYFQSLRGETIENE